MSTSESEGRARQAGRWSPVSPASPARASLPALIGVVYLSVAFGRGEIYPVSPMGMFSEVHDSAGRLVVRTGRGELREVADFRAWRCDGSLDFRAAYPACFPDGYSAGAVIAGDHIVSHPGAGEGERVALVRQIFRIAGQSGPVVIEECPLLSCTAVDGRR